MPLYAYQVLDGDGRPTGEVVEEFQRMADAPLTTLPPPDGRPCRKTVARVAVPPEWDGDDAASVQHQIDPKDLGEWRKDVPDLEIDQRGRFKFRSNSHQRKVYRQIAAGRERHRQARIAAVENNPRMQALRRKYEQADKAATETVERKLHEFAQQPAPAPNAAPSQEPAP